MMIWKQKGKIVAQKHADGRIKPIVCSVLEF